LLSWKASGTIPDLVVGILHALMDRAVGGLVFGWLYNRFLGRGSSTRVDRRKNTKERALCEISGSAEYLGRI